MPGKTALESMLIEKYPEKFNKLQQITTRKMRDYESQGNPYIFVTNEEYDEYEGSLIGKTKIHEDRYGTIFKPEANKYNTIILDKGGIDSFRTIYPDFSEINYIIVMVDSRKLKVREGRDPEYVENERWNIREVMNLCIVHNPPDYKGIEEMKNRIVEFFERYHGNK